MKRTMIDNIRKRMHLDMFKGIANICEEDILLCLMTRPINRSSLYTPTLCSRIYEVTKMKDSDTYESLGDAVYDVLFLNYMWRRKLPLDIYLLGRSKSNITFSRLVQRSPIYGLVCKTQKERSLKTVADVFESLIGMVYDHLVNSECETITDTLFEWMDRVFDISSVFYNLIYKRETPSGSVIYESGPIDLLSSYRLSIQKLATVYYIFSKCRHDPLAPTIIHSLYDPHRHAFDARVRESVDYAIGSDDVLRYAAIVSPDMKILLS